MLKGSRASKGSAAILQHLSSFSTKTLLSNGVQMYEEAGRRAVTFSSWGQGFFFQYWDDLEYFHHQEKKKQKRQAFVDKQECSQTSTHFHSKADSGSNEIRFLLDFFVLC